MEIIKTLFIQLKWMDHQDPSKKIKKAFYNGYEMIDVECYPL